MSLTKEDILKIATLARLELSEKEIESFGAQLSSILQYVEKLRELDVKGIEPTAHAIEIPTPFREDEIKKVPDREGTLFEVPPVLTP